MRDRGEGVKIHLPGETTAFIRPGRGEMLGAADARALRQFLRGQPLQPGENLAAGPEGMVLCSECVLWFVPNDGLWGRLASPDNKLHRLLMREVHSAMASFDPPQTGEIKRIATADQVAAYRRNPWPPT